MAGRRVRGVIGPAWWGLLESVGLSHEFRGAGGMVITPDVQVGYRYNQSASGQAFSLTAADGTPFEAVRVGLNGGSALVGASVTAHTGTWSAFVKYRAQVASKWTDQSASVGFRVAF